MNLAAAAIENRAVTYFFVFLLVVGGTVSFFQLGWLEDPEFTVKVAAITIPYPGATAEEVELEDGQLHVAAWTTMPGPSASTTTQNRPGSNRRRRS